MLSFVVSSMLAMGAGLTVSQISEPLRNIRLLVLALLANFVLMPLGALALAKVLSLDNPFAVGLLVLGCAAGAVLAETRRTCQGQPRICRYAAHRRNILDDVRA
jgi:predicted Na+-dependent transporter